MKKYEKNNVAQTPPMGWNSWDCYAAAVTEEQILENAKYMESHLKDFGWEYIICDIQWSDPVAGTGGSEYIPFTKLHMDNYSRLIPAENRFPSSKNGQGFRPIADKIHAMGLKFGIHIMRGIPRQAVHARTSILGTDITAEKIAIHSSICKWNSDMYGVDCKAEGAQAYYDSLFSLYASWHVDFVKVDDICNTNLYTENPYSAEKEIEMIRKAINFSGREMVLSLSPGPAVIEKSWHLRKYANMWRITDDFWDNWTLLKAMFERCEVWQSHVEPGCWPDCDMLPLGRIGMGFRKPRWTGFSKDEQVTMMTLWSIFRSPLMMGGEMRENDDWTLSLLTNEEVLFLHRYSHDAIQVERDAAHAIWKSYGDEGIEYIALFNLSDDVNTVRAELENEKKFQVRDLWAKENIGTFSESIEMDMPPHSARLFSIKD